MSEQIAFTGPLWVWTGAKGGVWHFVTITGAAAGQLTETALMRRLEGLGRGFGSLKVSATIGGSTWQTSVFPQKDAAGSTGWLLPVKAAVRKAEGLTAGEPAELELRF
ncbi:DUF1905 domain-containing protein [Novosphingobium flavum]|uniref:DUF1905 domain-containing protein n=1 Tax=Novosphingobium flavum TaxID=1778672 RepID=A0A7X1FQQ9_9SPHN|nr:DUF1905 domain-containing protein [Novosphingobium flavum]MBC2665213.1 DUF1905 domain-containing protein [Novosphingobium flavum]